MPESIVTTPPTMQVISITDPGAGNEFSYTIPADMVFLIHSIHIHFRASLGGVNRNTVLYVSDGGNIFLDLPIDSDIPGTFIRHYNWAAGQNYKLDADTNVSTAPLPSNLYLPAAYMIFTVTANLGANDRYDEIFLYVSPFILPVDRG